MLKKYFYEWLSNTSILVLIKIIKSKKCVSTVLWLIFSFVSSSLCSFYIYLTIDNYLSYPVVTNTELAYEPKIEFPMIRICQPDYKNTNYSIDSLMDCSFAYDNQCKTNKTMFFENDEFPQCYNFNTGKNMLNQSIHILYSVLSGIDNGLCLSINSSSKIDLRIQNKTNKKEITNLELLPGYSYEISIDRIIEKKLEYPYNKCIKNINEFGVNKTIIDYFQNNDIDYYYEKCLDLCFELDYINSNDSCNCPSDSFGSIWDDCYFDSIFFNENSSDCISAKKTGFYQSDSFNKCESYCPRVCETVHYSVAVNTKKLANDISIEFYVFYSHLEYIHISQIAKISISDVVSNIGGTISLFIGLSFISLFECFELFIEFLLYAKKNVIGYVSNRS